MILFDSSAAGSAWSGSRGAAGAPLLSASSHDTLNRLAELEKLTRSTRWAGFFNYDLGRCFEVLPRRAVDDLALPMMQFAECDDSSINLRADGQSESLQANHSLATVAPPQFRRTFTREGYEHAVQRCLDYISAGDVFQVNLSQRFSAAMAGDPFSLFRRLQHDFPAAYGAFLDFGEYQILSNSPELFLRVITLPDGRRKIINRPIKGTRPNAAGMFDALLHSEKDKAELTMIVDLQRNDLGRICEIGSVRVTEPRTIETHPTVLHGVATIEGILRPEISLVDILRATFPCGSVTGCPKIRAMEIIDELEPVRRGAYCGAIGWIHNGDMEFAVAIRTMTIKNGLVHIPVGGGIVADSDPAAEYEETLVKARAMFAAIGIQNS